MARAACTGAETEGPARLPDMTWGRTNLDSAAAWQATNSASSSAAAGNSLPTRGSAPGPAPAKRTHKVLPLACTFSSSLNHVRG